MLKKRNAITLLVSAIIAALIVAALGCSVEWKPSEIPGTGETAVDFRLDNKDQLKVIEVNPNPDISPNAGAALQAQTAGMTYNQFVEQIVRLAV